MTFACVDVGPLYGPEYVKRLWSGLKRHSSCRDIICFTDHPDEFVGFGPGFTAYDISAFMAIPPPPSGVPARWGCINLFAPIDGVDRLLYTDLDNVIIDDIDPLIGYAKDKPLVTIREWGAAWTTMAAGVMAIECNTALTEAIWNDYATHGPAYNEYLFQGFCQRSLERHGLFDQGEFWRSAFRNPLARYTADGFAYR